MPSGSHRSSRSSFRSRSSSSRFRSSRSSRASSASSSSNYRHHQGGRVNIFVAGGKFSPFIFIALFWVFVFSVVIVSINDDLSAIKEEYIRYDSMITRALNNSEYRVEAEVTSMNESNGKYYITYTIEDFGYSNVWGISFPIYTLSEAEQLMVDGVTLALSKKVSEMTEFTDSVPIDHTIDKMNIDSDYISAINSRTRFIIIDVIMVGVTVLFIVLTIVHAIKKKNNNSQQVQDSANTVSTYVCAHCGGVLSQGMTKCSSCGSSERKKN